MAEPIVTQTIQEIKTCKTCKTSKPLSDFYLSKGYRSNDCRICWQKKYKKPSKGNLNFPYIDEATGQTIKKCRDCQQLKSLDQYRMVKQKTGKYPYSYCKDCQDRQGKDWRQANIEAVRLQARIYHKNNADKIAIRRRKYVSLNREKARMHSQAYNRRHKELLRLKAKLYHQKNRPQRIAYCRKYNLEHYAKRLQYRQQNAPILRDILNRYRARKRNAPVIEKVSRDKVIERDFSLCYLCNRKLTPCEIVLDHIVPLSKNGSHTEDNLAVTCDRCNKSKGNKSLLIFIATRVPFD